MMRPRKRLICLVMAGLFNCSAYADGWPDALPDNAATQQGTPTSIYVLANDVGNDLTLKSVNDWTVEGGRAVIDVARQSITYTPKNGFTGNDSFWYVFEDNQGRTNAAKVTVFVSAEDDINERPAEWPVAIADRVDVKTADPVRIAVLENDIGRQLTLKSANEYSANGGKVRISGDSQTVTYESLRPMSEWPYTDEFWYVFTDGWGRTNAAKVTLRLDYSIAPEAWPDANPDTQSTLKNTPVTINVLANDVGEGLSLKSVNESTVQWGRVEVKGDALIYTPRYNFTGEDEFWYVFEDAWGRTNSNKVSVTVSNAFSTVRVPLNDTGMTACGNYTGTESSDRFNRLNASSNSLGCEAATDTNGTAIPGNQDATMGRDVTHNDSSDGLAGFSFTKLDANGNPLGASASAWSCVKDNVTGLIWEAKRGGGNTASLSALHNSGDTYVWYTTDPALDGGVTVVPESSTDDYCVGSATDGSTTHCTTGSFVNRVNSAGLCGITSWRMPSPTELSSLVNFDSRSTLIDRQYFPGTQSDFYATNSIVQGDGTTEPLHTGVDFSLNLFLYPFYATPLGFPMHVRLVSSEQLGE